MAFQGQTMDYQFNHWSMVSLFNNGQLGQTGKTESWLEEIMGSYTLIL